MIVGIVGGYSERYSIENICKGVVRYNLKKDKGTLDYLQYVFETYAFELGCDWEFLFDGAMTAYQVGKLKEWMLFLDKQLEKYHKPEMADPNEPVPF